MIVRCDGCELDTGVDHEVDEGRFHLGLSGFEVVATDERAVFLGELDAAGYKSVLRRAVDERCVLQDTCHGEDGGG